jgi:hypothetical protein
MRKEVKYARLSCTYMKPPSCLKLTKNSASLTSEDYVENLTSYLDTARSCRNLTLRDLNHVLLGMSSKLPTSAHSVSNTVSPTTLSTSKPSTSDSIVSTQTDNPFSVGEHIAVFWLGEKYNWYLGVVDSVKANFYCTDTSKKSWVYPENSDIHNTPIDQVLFRNIRVEYVCSVRVRCKISDALVAELDSYVQTLNEV